MADNPTVMLVVAGALRDDNGRFLMQKRPEGKRHAGLWEFPGGKVESGENPRFALVRELSEELGIAIEPAAITPAAFAEHEADSEGPAIVILLYMVPCWAGDPQSLEGCETGWFDVDEARNLPKPELDRQLLASLIDASSKAS